MTEDKNMGRNIENELKWRKENIRRYEFTLNKTTNKLAYEHLEKQPNKRAYIISLIEKDAKKNGI